MYLHGRYSIAGLLLRITTFCAYLGVSGPPFEYRHRMYMHRRFIEVNTPPDRFIVNVPTCPAHPQNNSTIHVPTCPAHPQNNSTILSLQPIALPEQPVVEAKTSLAFAEAASTMTPAPVARRAQLCDLDFLL